MYGADRSQRRDMGQKFARLVRMVVILDPSEYDDWLSCSAEQARRYFRQWHGHLDAFAAALPPRVSTPKAPKPPEADPETGELF